MKILHFADYHLGADTSGPLDKDTKLNFRVVDYLDTLDTIVDFSIEEEVDLVVFAGDAFHRSSPSPTYTALFAERIVDISKHCPVFLIPGNHDMPGMVERASAIDIFDVISYPNIIVGLSFEVHKVKTKSGIIQVASYPYPMRQQIFDPSELTGVPTDLYNSMVKSRSHEILSSLEKDISNRYPAILVGHFSVDSAIYGSERSMTIGTDAALSKTALQSGPWDYVALGHIHLHQDVSKGKGTPIVYSGSCERVDFGEEHDSKGVCLVEIRNGKTTWEFVDVDARKYSTIEVDACQSEYDPTDLVLDKIDEMNLKGHIVRVRLTIDDDYPVHQEEIRSALEEAEVAIIHSIVVRRIDPERTTRLAQDVELQGMQHIDLLDMYFETVNLEPLDGLLELAKDIMVEAANGKEDQSS